MNALTVSIIGGAVGVIALLISLWNLLSPYLLGVRTRIIPESQIQIINAFQKNKKLTAFNILFTIVSKGPSNKWIIYKFHSAFLTIPNKSKIKYRCWSVLEEKGMGQSNSSRNIPHSMNGNSSKTLTLSFQSNEFEEWIVGEYSASFEVSDSNNNKVYCNNIAFQITESSLKVVQVPNGILMLDSELV